MDVVLVSVRYLFTLVFGLALSCSFAGLRPNRRELAGIVVFLIFEVALQAALRALFGIDFIRMAYPLMTHVPLVLLLILWCKCEWTVSIGSVLTAYLCCELPNVAEKLTLAITGGDTITATIAYMIACVFFAAFLMHYVAHPISQLLSYSMKSCLAFSVAPLVYYIWCYAAGVYTGWIQENSYEAMIAVSGMFAALFVVFAAVYSVEVRNKAKLEESQKKTEMQLQQAGKELETLSRIQRLTSEYRHDTRHRLRMLAALANAGDMQAIREFIREADQDLDAVTPQRYSANETLNMVLSYFADKCANEEIDLKLKVKAPKDLPLSNTEICTLIGNALDNAVEACAAQASGNIDAQIIEHRGKLLISIANDYANSITFEGDLPISAREGHGYGCASIKTIAERHRGQALFTADGGKFTLKVVIPLN